MLKQSDINKTLSEVLKFNKNEFNKNEFNKNEFNKNYSFLSDSSFRLKYSYFNVANIILLAKDIKDGITLADVSEDIKNLQN